MRHLLSLLPILLVTAQAWGDSVGSLYNGEQYNLDGTMLVQDSEKPDEFYYLPTHYHLDSTVPLNSNGEPVLDSNGVPVVNLEVVHTIFPVDNPKYSSYSMTFKIDEPGTLSLLQAQQALRHESGRAFAKIKGMVPVCGLRIADAGFSDARPQAGNLTPGPNGTLIRFSFSSTAADKCDSVIDPTRFKVEYTVDLNLEPDIAHSITSDIGMVLPAVELVLPYKYKDHVVIHVDTQLVTQQLKAAGDFTGSFKLVTASVKGSVESLMSRLEANGSITRDCQSTDHAICDNFVQQAEEILEKTLYIFTPLVTQGDTNPLTLADSDKSAGGATMFRASAAVDYSKSQRDGAFDVDFTNVNYGTIRTQIQLNAADVPRSVLDKQVRNLLDSRYPENQNSHANPTEM